MQEVNEAQSWRCLLLKGCDVIKGVNGPTNPFYSGTSCFTRDSEPIGLLEIPTSLSLFLLIMIIRLGLDFQNHSIVCLPSTCLQLVLNRTHFPLANSAGLQAVKEKMSSEK